MEMTGLRILERLYPGPTAFISVARSMVRWVTTTRDGNPLIVEGVA